jgi:hypothetical protein
MKGQDIMLIATTALLGLVAGMYLYVVGFAPEFLADNGRDVEEYETLAIEGEVYGGMRAGTPPSFQVLADGSFRYLPFTERGGEVAPQEGTLPRALRNELKTALVATELEAASRPVTPEMCAQMYDGIDYRYHITVEGISYKLDTCGTDFGVDTALGESLGALWTYFEETLPE